jgi:hypothetical protein
MHFPTAISVGGEKGFFGTRCMYAVVIGGGGGKKEEYVCVRCKLMDPSKSFLP